MRDSRDDHLTPKAMTWVGFLFLVLLVEVTYRFFGQGIALGMGVGIVIGVINFKAIAFLVRRLMRPDGPNKLLYGIFGFLKFLILAGVFFLLIHYQVFDVYGIVAGFSAVLLLVMMEGLFRANHFDGNELTAEEK